MMLSSNDLHIAKLVSAFRLTVLSSLLALLLGCGGSGGGSSTTEDPIDTVVPEQPTDDPQQDPEPEAQALIGTWLTDCGLRDAQGQFMNELTLTTSGTLTITENRYDNSNCNGTPVESSDVTTLKYTYPEENRDSNDKFIRIALFPDNNFSIDVYFEVLGNLLYLSHKFQMTHEGYAMDSSKEDKINYDNYLTKKQ